MTEGARLRLDKLEGGRRGGVRADNGSGASWASLMNGSGSATSGHIDARLPHSKPGSGGTAYSGSGLTVARLLCYGARLSLSFRSKATLSTGASFFPNIFGTVCHELSSVRVVLLLLFSLNLGAQIFSPPLPSPGEGTPQPSPNVNVKLKIARESGPPSDEYYFNAIQQTTDGPWRHLRMDARVETSEMLLTADEIDWNTDSGDVELRGNVHYINYVRGEKLDCDRAEVNIEDDTGRFYKVKGSAMSTVQARPGLLTTQNPFYFQSKWAERIKDHYILHDGFLTDCLMPRPWWVLKGPEFDIVPGDHAVARRSWFFLRKIPLFYTPWFYKSLEKEPRKSGFLIPDVGNNSLHGKMVGFGYYWAISRSFDLTYLGQYYSLSGLANHVEVRGKINESTGFDLTVFGIKDTQQTTPDSSGVRINLVSKDPIWATDGNCTACTRLPVVVRISSLSSRSLSTKPSTRRRNRLDT